MIKTQSILDVKPATSHYSHLSYLGGKKTEKGIEDIEIIQMDTDTKDESSATLSSSKMGENSWTNFQNLIKTMQNELKSVFERLLDFLSKVKIEPLAIQEIMKVPFIHTTNLILYLSLINDFFKEKDIDSYLITVSFEEDPELIELNTILLRIHLNLPFEYIIDYWEDFERLLEFKMEEIPDLNDYPVFFESSV